MLDTSETEAVPSLRIGPLFRDPGTERVRDLIERVGLAGFIMGKVQIAPQDPNMLLNLGGTQAHDALTVIEMTHRTVLQQLSIGLALALDVYGDRLPAEAFPPLSAP